MIPFTPWRPDEATVGNAFAANARNVLPVSVRSDGSVIWSPFPDFSELTGAANGQVFAARGFVLPDGTIKTVIGTADKLYMIDNTDNTLDDVSGTSYNANATARWHFDVYGYNIIATNINDGPQRFLVGTDSTFSDLAGTPTHGHLVSVWKDQLVIGALTNNLEGVQWSEINDITDWTGGNSDTQVFPGFGAVTAISRGNTPLVVQEYGIQRGVFTGTDTVFEFDTLTEEFGCRIRGATAFRRNQAFFWSDEGFKAIGRDGAIQHIGFRKVDDWVRRNVDFGNDFGFIAVVDPVRPFIYWGCLSQDAEEKNALNTLLAYNVELGEWGRASINLEWLFGWQQQGWTLETLDTVGTLDALPFSLDSRAWRSDFPVLGGVTKLHKAGQFAGENKAARMETGEFAPAEGARTRIKKVRPLIDGAGVTVTHFGRDNRSEAFTAGAAEPLFPRTQEAHINRSARFHKLRVDVEAGSTWSLATGLEETVAAESRW